MDLPHLNHSPIVGHFDCFQVLAIVNKAAINRYIGFCVDIILIFLWDKCPGMQLLGCMESVCLVFKGTDKLISRVVSTPTMSERSKFFASLSTFCMISIFKEF